MESNSDTETQSFGDLTEDWEQLVDNEEEQRKTEQAIKATAKEKKQIIRAPTAAKVDEEKELPQNVQREVERMQKEASDLSSAAELMSEEVVDYIADHPVKTKEDAERLGELISNRILTFSHNDHFPDIVLNVCKAISKDFVNLQVVNEKIAQVGLLREELKRAHKAVKKPVS